MRRINIVTTDHPNYEEIIKNKYTVTGQNPEGDRRIPKKDVLRRDVANAYYELLSAINWENEILVRGLREGLNKFLSNAFLRLNQKRKYLQGDYYSKEALRKLSLQDYSDLVYEHIVPKQKFIQRPCEEAAKEKELTLEFVTTLLEKYWHIAIITKDEDKIITRCMPNGWNGKDLFVRYQSAGVHLIPATEARNLLPRPIAQDWVSI